jgi:membrane protease YdiL (CAAX protease family)
LALVFAGLCLANFLAFLLVQLLYDFSFRQFGQLDTLAARLPHGQQALLLTQGVAGIGLAAGALAVPRLYQQPLRDYFAPRPLTSGWWPLGASGLLLCTVPLAATLLSWNAQLHLPASWQALEHWARGQEQHAQQLIHGLTRFQSAAQFLAALLVLALLPTVAEEVIFRGVLQRQLGRWLGSAQAGIWLTAVLFSALHVQFLGFVPRLLLGLILGYLYAWSCNLMVPMVAHFTQNAGQLLLLWLTQRRYVAPMFNPEAWQAWPWPVVLVSSLLTAGILYTLHQCFKHRLASLNHPGVAF